jgi:hypothetical protein
MPTRPADTEQKCAAGEAIGHRRDTRLGQHLGMVQAALRPHRQHRDHFAVPDGQECARRSQSEGVLDQSQHPMPGRRIRIGARPVGKGHGEHVVFDTALETQVLGPPVDLGRVLVAPGQQPLDQVVPGLTGSSREHPAPGQDDATHRRRMLRQEQQHPFVIAVWLGGDGQEERRDIVADDDRRQCKGDVQRDAGEPDRSPVLDDRRGDRGELRDGHQVGQPLTTGRSQHVQLGIEHHHTGPATSSQELRHLVHPGITRGQCREVAVRRDQLAKPDVLALHGALVARATAGLHPPRLGTRRCPREHHRSRGSILVLAPSTRASRFVPRHMGDRATPG